MFTLFRSPRNAPQQQAGLAAAHAEIRKLQQENAFIQKQIAPKPSTTDVPPSPSRHTTSSIVFPTPSKRFSSPNNISPPPPKVAKPERNNSQLSLTATARRTNRLKLIHVPVLYCLPLQQLCSNLCRLHINVYQILDIHYSDRNSASFLIHHCKFNTPVDPSIIRDPTFINEPTETVDTTCSSHFTGLEGDSKCRPDVKRVCLVNLQNESQSSRGMQDD
ncbi:hypothetical protein G6F37_000006 [Rhizopus arrhizus]|nr:hypothetical protein G6F38_000020 [Rhizopus arrhizus]KAG1164722.1 hypothetical protein G6F37_000006 [Rhizopus arrhizus]